MLQLSDSTSREQQLIDVHCVIKQFAVIFTNRITTELWTCSSDYWKQAARYNSTSIIHSRNYMDVY